jgi:LmbE family N-acetylglucosaminyl deacetylase
MATRTLLAMGAHLDDCIFGVPGLMLQAIRKHYRVVILAMVGDLSNWPPAKGREREIVEGTQRLCTEYGAEMRVLHFASMRYDVSLDTKRAVAEVVADVQPDLACMLWPHDTHADHEVAAQLSKVALRHGGRVVDPLDVKPPRAIYCYDNGPGHTIGFVPNTFVDVSDAWPQAIEWLGKYMALQQNRPYDPQTRDGAQQAKEALARYRGQSCGVRYAEALWSLTARPQEIL